MTSLFKRLFKISKKPAISGVHAQTKLPQKKAKTPNISKALNSHELADNQKRQEALTTVNQATTLSEIVKLIDQHPEIRDAIEEKALAIVSSNGQIGLTNNTELHQLITSSTNGERWMSTISKLPEETLLPLASKAKLAQYRAFAAQHISNEKLLEQLEKMSKGKDKKVFQIARQKLHAKRSEQKEVENAQSILKDLLEQLSSLARADVDRMFEARLSVLEQKWELSQHAATTALNAEHRTWVNQCNQKLLTYKQEKEKRAEVEKRLSLQTQERESTLDTLQETVERFKTTFCGSSEIASLDAIIKTQENRWLEATRGSTATHPEGTRYQNLLNELKDYLLAVKRYWSTADELEQLIKDVDTDSATISKGESLKRLKEALSALSWPVDYVKAPLLLLAYEKIGQAKQAQNIEKSDLQSIDGNIKKLLVELEKQLDEKNLRDSIPLAKRINNALQTAPAPCRARHTQTTQRLMKALDELKDWQGFATLPKFSELCEMMEHLAENSMDPELKAEKVKALQNEWRKLGGSSDQQLWDRFKAAADKAYEPCKNYYNEEKALKKANLDKRLVICNELANFIENNHWESSDWKAVETICRAAKDDWKSAFPVDFKANREPQQQFNALINELESKLNEERQKNKNEKQRIIDAANALMSLENTQEAIATLKGLQTEWKKVGITLHKEDRVLWKAFRNICDQIFARREELKAKKQDSIQEAIVAANEINTKIEKLFEETNNATLTDAISLLRNQLAALDALPSKNREQTNKGLESLQELITHRNQADLIAEKLAVWREVERKSTLCHNALENISQTGDIGDEFASRIKLPEQIEKTFDQIWLSIKNNLFIGSYHSAPGRGGYLCILCEILAGLESPPEDRSQRMEIQVERLSGAFNSTANAGNTATQIEEAALEWFTLVDIPTSLRNRQLQRIEAATAVSISN